MIKVVCALILNYTNEPYMIVIDSDKYYAVPFSNAMTNCAGTVSELLYLTEYRRIIKYVDTGALSVPVKQYTDKQQVSYADYNPITTGDYLNKLRPILFEDESFSAYEEISSDLVANDLVGMERYTKPQMFTEAVKQYAIMGGKHLAVLLMQDTLGKDNQLISDWWEDHTSVHEDIAQEYLQVRTLALLGSHCALKDEDVIDSSEVLRKKIVLVDAVIDRFSMSRQMPLAVGWAYNPRQKWFPLKTFDVQVTEDTPLVRWKDEKYLREPPLFLSKYPELRAIDMGYIIVSPPRPLGKILDYTEQCESVGRKVRRKLTDIDFELEIRGNASHIVGKSVSVLRPCILCSKESVGYFKLNNGIWGQVCEDHIEHNVRCVGKDNGYFYPDESLTYANHILQIKDRTIRLVPQSAR